MIVKTYKKGRKILCYIRQDKTGFFACTGKPSDISCVAWKYDNMKDAEKTALEYFENRTNMF